MRRILSSVVMAAVVALAGSAYAQNLNVVSWGGAYTASQQKAYHDPYMKANPGVKIVNHDLGSGALAKLRAEVESGKVTLDLIDMTAADAIVACDEGLVEQIEADKWLAAAPDGTPASGDFFAGTLSVGGTNCFIPQIVYSTTFGYRTDVFKGQQPSTLADVFDLKKFPGKRALEKRPNNNMEWALIADGVPAKDVYKMLSTDEGVARAFAKLDTIKSQVVWWTKGAQPPQLLADGEVAIASAYNGRLFSAIIEKKQPIAMLWDWQNFDLDGWVVPKGTKNLAAVKKYLRFATDTQRLADQAKYISYGPARHSSAGLVGKHAELGVDMKPHMPTDPANSKTVLLSNYVWWADHQTELNDKFNAWLAK